MAPNSYSILFVVFSTIIIQQSHGMDFNITGLWISAYTPFHQNGSVNYDFIPTVARCFKDSGFQNVLIISQAGDGFSLNLAESKRIVWKWVQTCKRLGLNILVQIGGQPLYEAVQLAKYCNELKLAGRCIEGIAVLPVIPYKGNLDEVVNDLQLLSNAAPDLPMFFEDLPFFTTPKVPAVEVLEAASKQICTLVGVISTMDGGLLVRSTPSLKDMIVGIAGNDAIAAAFASGFKISLTAAGSLFPKQVLAIEEAYRNRNYEEGERQQAVLNRNLAKVHYVNNNTIRYTDRSFLEFEKEAYRLIFGIDLCMRIPLVKPNPDEIQQIADNLQSIGVELKEST